jgi:hypothetical protein
MIIAEKTENKIALHEEITFSLPSGIVDKVGQDEICNLLPDALPVDWKWECRIGGKGEYVGTLPKRIAKYFYQKYRTKLPSDLLGKIGSIMSAHTNNQNDYCFDFTNKFDWDSGDYGDRGSCYWGCHSSAKDLLQDNGALAMRFYNEGKGYARAWLYPRNSGYVVFNGYGLETIQISRILASYLGLSYRKITLENNGESSGTIWINGASGFIVDSEENVNSIECYDLGIENDSSCCTNCGHCTDELTNVGDDFLCENCLSDDYFYCEDCGEYCCNDDWNDVDGQGVCDSCLDNYFYCEICNKYHSADMVEVDGKSICSDCLDDETFTCDCCENLRLNSYHNRIGDKVICDDCKDEYYSDCLICGGLHEKDDLTEIDGHDFCDDCKDCAGQRDLVEVWRY